MRTSRRLSLALLTALPFTTAVATAIAQITPSGTPVVSVECSTVPSVLGLDGNMGDSAVAIAVSDNSVPFTRAVRIINAHAKAHTYDAFHYCNSISDVAAGDVVLATYWVRNASPESAKHAVRIEADFQLNSAPYSVDVVTNAPVDVGRWKQFVVPFRIKNTAPAGIKSFQLRFGAGAQTFEFGGVSLMNYGPIAGALPDALKQQLTFYYPGRGDPAVAWRTAALANIEATRKAPVVVRVINPDGSPATRARVVLKQTRSSFNWETSVQPSDIVGGPRATPGLSKADLNRYRAAIKANFNSASMQNELKWPDWEQDRDTPTRALDWFRVNGLVTRGHNLFWPGYEPYYLLPSDIRDPKTPNAQVRKRALNHITEIVGKFQGQIPEWDVINEPYDHYDLQGRVAAPPFTVQVRGRLGNAVVADWFKQTQKTDPATLLFINDYNIFSSLDPAHRDYIIEFTKNIQANGARVDGLGFQSHFVGNGPVFSEMADSLALYDPLVAHYSATEFDFISLDETLQADVLADYATFVFGSPKFNTFQLWGFWDGNQDDRNGPLYRTDWSLKPAGLVWQTLMRKTWRTNVAGRTDGAGQYAARAFLGRYQISVSACGKTTVFIRDIASAVSFTLPSGCS